MGLKNDKLIHFKAKLFTVDVSAKTQGHCRDLHGQQEQIQTAEVWGQGHQKCENWTPGLCQGIGCSLLLPLSCIGFQVKFLLKDRWREFMEKRRALGGWKKQNLSHKKNVRNLAKWMFRCLLRWDNLTDNLKPIYLFLFSSPTFTAFSSLSEETLMRSKWWLWGWEAQECSVRSSAYHREWFRLEPLHAYVIEESSCLPIHTWPKRSYVSSSIYKRSCIPLTS